MTLRKTPSSRYGGYSPDLIDRARNSAPGVGLYQTQTNFCVRCQQDKPKLGFTRRMGLSFCAGCK